MKIVGTVICSALMAVHSAWAAGNPPAAPNGIEMPAHYRNWRVLGVSHREDNQSLRVIVGNDTAVNAAKAGQTRPWPKGSILGKLVWKDRTHPDWDTATVPGELLHAEFMIKDADRYAKTGGWGYARWTGMEQAPYGKDEHFVQECLACHNQVKENDSVFTRPAPLP